jgi:hypothetical protein
MRLVISDADSAVSGEVIRSQLRSAASHPLGSNLLQCRQFRSNITIGAVQFPNWPQKGDRGVTIGAYLPASKNL